MRRVTGIICALMLISTFQLKAQVTEAQAMFIYNFSRLIEWPAGSKTGDFTIGVLGNSDLLNSLTDFVAGKKVGSQNISVKKFNDVNEITACHILFISFGKSGKIDEVQQKVRGNYSLIIGEKKGLVDQGAAINFVIDDTKLHFQLNMSNAEKYQLKVSKSLQEMAML
jgi:hypothetical protein